MQSDKSDLIKLAIEKSQNSLSEAEDNFKIDYFAVVLNRIYYSVFYIVTALAYKYNFVTSKHSQLKSWFNRKFIYEDKIFDTEMLKTYEESFAYRQKSDYDLRFIPDVKLVKDLLFDAKKFVKSIEDFLYDQE
ncbi:MAG: HEPN domain-containing protein [Heliobacteriaceae bacterium]|jgi:uncharacterized protein (UPF0332 family)|nr:HEPN domain-containing protein [Heliobacteriaceae bacterium]